MKPNLQRWALLILIFGYFSTVVWGQNKPREYYNGNYLEYYLKANGFKFKVFDINVTPRPIQCAYFGKNGKEKYKNWKKNNKRAQVLCFFAVGFSKDLEENNTPIGLCIEQGRPLNRALNKDMDGIVMVDSRGRLSALDIDYEKYKNQYNLRKASDKSYFINVASHSRLSVFQTQLMYSLKGGSKIGELKFGKKATRRLLAICKDRNGQEHHIILDLVKAAHLNNAAQAALKGLLSEGYEVLYLLNQDTGSRNIMTAYDDNEKKIYSAPVDLQNATQLLVYYRK